MIIKLDMSKAHDRMSWIFLMAVMRKFGFSENWIDIIWRLVSNVWYYIIINGSGKGFFTSSQDLKQGDHLSPSLERESMEPLCSQAFGAQHPKLLSLTLQRVRCFPMEQNDSNQQCAPIYAYVHIICYESSQRFQSGFSRISISILNIE
uniref:Uncharacterized protein LOC104234597 n=1 Tax=Nicotiana sylvestris TaxID=4096 RepID=A0A1U7XA21_NICSY|nr:PREDICTED: uncharacterized protein LOC104234597 [Nicotiana sylvestris]